MTNLICGDVLEELKKLKNDSVDLVVTSPPYNLGIDYGKNINDSMSLKDYFAYSENWIKEVFRILKDSGRFALIHYLSCGKSKKRFAPLMRLN